MNKIKILDSSLIDQIAAGEVVERPASILKELLENSIDANSTNIKIKIKGGGINSIQIIDDGIGISEKDINLAFTRHATSKINNIEDLNSIESLGFRGEALPSIASISQVELTSTTKNNLGYTIKINGGKTISIKPKKANQGTSITVSNIFYNTPARRKFLKSIQSEQLYIYKVIRYFFISNPDISFTFINNNKIIYDLKPSKLKERIINTFPSTNMNELINVDLSKNSLDVSGFCGSLSMLKKRPGEQYLFINGRFVTNKLLNSAVYSCYKTVIKRGEYPFFILFISMPSEDIDVNVHPAKLDVRLKNDWQIYHLVKLAINNSLKNILNVAPYLDKNKQYSPYNNMLDDDQLTGPSINMQNAPRQNMSKFENNKQLDLDRILSNIEDNNENSNNIINSISGGFIWQIHNKYLLTEIKTGIVIIDQHVAHERVLFELAKNALSGSPLPSQTLLFPQTLNLEKDEYNYLTNISHYLEKIGFKFREFGKDTILIEGSPADISIGMEKKIIKEILEQYIDTKEHESEFIDNIAATYACKSAIKAGDFLEEKERKVLVDRLFSTEHPYYCPHGRPIIFNLSMDEIDSRFERI